MDFILNSLIVSIVGFFLNFLAFFEFPIKRRAIYFNIEIHMSITKSGIVTIFTSNTQQYELEKEMKKFRKVKALIDKRKSQMYSNREQTGHSKKMIQ